MFLIYNKCSVSFFIFLIKEIEKKSDQFRFLFITSEKIYELIFKYEKIYDSGKSFSSMSLILEIYSYALLVIF